MAKLTISFPSGWDNHMIVDSKDFATLCDIFERSQGYITNYAKGETYQVAKTMLLEGKMYNGEHIISQAEYETILNQPTETGGEQA